MTMRRTVLTAAVSALLATPSLAEESAPWTGWYGGAHAGYRWVDADFSSPSYRFGINTYPARDESYDADGAIAGLQLGYGRVRPGTNWLWGVEADISWGGGDGSRTTNGSAPLTPGEIGPPSLAFVQTSELEANWQATLRARLGKVRGEWLYYATAGVAWMDIGWSDTISFPAFPGIVFSSSDSATLTGFTVGAGVEKQLKNPLWRARLEYLYENFGDETVPHGPTTPRQQGEIEIDAHKLRVAISRKFGRRAPDPYK